MKMRRPGAMVPAAAEHSSFPSARVQTLVPLPCQLSQPPPPNFPIPPLFITHNLGGKIVKLTHNHKGISSPCPVPSKESPAAPSRANLQPSKKKNSKETAVGTTFIGRSTRQRQRTRWSRRPRKWAPVSLL